MSALNTASAAQAALAIFHSTPGTEEEKVVAALAEYQAHLLDSGVVVLPQAEHAVHTTEGDLEDAAEWLGQASGHARFSGSAWRDLLTQPHLLDMAVIKALGQQQAHPQGHQAVYAAAGIIKAHYAATGVVDRQVS